MSAPNMVVCSTSSAKSKHSVRVAQTTADTSLQAVYEKSGGSVDSFDYSKYVGQSTAESVPARAVTAYLQRMQRGGFTQSFGCMVAVEDENLRVIAYSENASEFLDLMPQAVPSLGEMDVLGIGTDLRTLFTPSSAASLEQVAATQDMSLFNPITVQCSRSGKPLYAIAHRIDVGIVIDFEAVITSISAAGVLQSHHLVNKAITRLQALPRGDIWLLCDTVVKEVQKLTGYDRVMVYRFHEDEHGEVVAELRRSDLDPYLGLHYPATDIPQASRFLLMKNRVEMIADCCASPVKVIQDPNIKQPISLAGSTLRGCHTQYMGNMGAIASLAMSVIISDDEDDSPTGAIERGRKLWGLVLCLHSSPRTVPFSLRSACEFLMQVFGMQLNMEVELAAQRRKTRILSIQALLCGMFLRDSPIGIVSRYPNIMDLLNCDGAALYFGERLWLFGTTPPANQIKDIAKWLLEYRRDSAGLSTDSLADANYPGAYLLGDAVCGISAAKISEKDILFWFKSGTSKDMKWGGARHYPGGNDDGRKMQPRALLKQSLPWEDVEMDSIHSLQLILRGSFQDIDDISTKTMIHARLSDLKHNAADELSSVTNEMVRLTETATAPILLVDLTGMINGWNAKIAQVTGLPAREAKGLSLVKDLVLYESVVVVERLLYLASQGEEEQNVEIMFKTFGTQKEKGAVILIFNACGRRDASDNVIGVCLVGQDVIGQKIVMDKFSRMQGDYETIVQNPHPLIPPIFGSDEFGYCFEWNPAMEGLTGWKRDEVVGKLIVGEIFGMQMICCRMKSQDAMSKFMISLNNGMDGVNTDNFSFSFFDREGKIVDAILSTNKRTDANGVITGVFCFLQDCVAGSVERLELYLKRAEECMEAVQQMSTREFNNEQCQYLADKFQGVLLSASAFLELMQAEDHGHSSFEGMARHIENFKLLVALANATTSFIRGCCKDEWIQAAMTLTNVSEHVSSVGFNLELCRVAWSKECAASGRLSLEQVVDIHKAEIEIVKKKASEDWDNLVVKVVCGLTEKSFSSTENDLAAYLLQRLHKVKPVPVVAPCGSSWWSVLGSLYKWVKPLEKLGKGSSGSVYRGIWLGTPVAKKTFPGQSNPEFKREAEILGGLCHPNITSMYCCAVEKNSCSIVMELMDEDLHDMMQGRCNTRFSNIGDESPPFTIFEAVDIMLQVGEGVNYLHNQVVPSIVHRDLKSSNILVKYVVQSDSEIGYVYAKVTDFGLSRTKDRNTRHSHQTPNSGTGKWMAPEVIKLGSKQVSSQASTSRRAEMFKNYPHKSDVYSFAIVCYEILTGHEPFPNEFSNAVKRKVLDGERPSLPTYCPLELKALIEECWNQEPRKRPSFDVICLKLKYLKYLLMMGFSSNRNPLLS